MKGHWHPYEMIFDEPMISGDGWDLSFPDISLTVQEKPGKTSTRNSDPTGLPLY